MHFFLASWLQKYCKLNVFLDSQVWKSADGLLLEIDDNHCKNKGTGNYIYKRRNLKGFQTLTCENLWDLYDQGFEGLLKLYKISFGVDLLLD